MRQSQVFSKKLYSEPVANGVGGSSHPELSERIAERLGMQLGDAALGKFSNGEKSVEIRSVSFK
jgi:phosphoribosylpyrophosphate synthetase